MDPIFAFKLDIHGQWEPYQIEASITATWRVVTKETLILVKRNPSRETSRVEVKSTTIALNLLT